MLFDSNVFRVVDSDDCHHLITHWSKDFEDMDTRDERCPTANEHNDNHLDHSRFFVQRIDATKSI